MNSKARSPSGPSPGDVIFRSSSNSWTALAECLENEGRWTELLSIVPEKNLSPRWRVAAARAYAFLGQLDLAANELKSISYENANLEVEVIGLLTESAILRQQQKWEAALVLSETAYAEASRISSSQLMSDALFAQAVSHSEMGKIFRAISLFQNIREAEGRVSSYRKGLAALNEAWCLWDTGQIEHLREVLPFIPVKYRAKIEVYCALLDNKVPLLEEWITHGFSETPPPADLVQILLVLSEWRFITEQRFENSWHDAQLKRHGEKSPILNACVRLLNLEKIAWPEDLVAKDWRLAVEIGFLSFLSMINDHSVAEKIYREKLSPLMRKHRMKTPLMPWWEELLKAESPWTSKIMERFSQQDKSNERVINRFSLQDGTLSLDNKKLDFNRSPISLKLLIILAGRKGRRLSKQELHLLLTGSKYSPSIHDSRLHKLLRRTDEKIRKYFGVSILQAPGDNTVVLKAHLELR